MKKYYLSFLMFVTGICYSQNVSPLNNITSSEIILPQENDTYITIALNKDMGYYSYTFNNLNISVVYTSRTIDLLDKPYEKRYLEIMTIAENYNNGIIEEIPIISWHQNSRFSNFNGLKYFDTFSFSEHEFTDKQLTRILYITTNNHYIMIRISLPYTYAQRERLFDSIFEEVPQYFRIFSDKHINNPIIIWDFENKGNIKCGNDLINGKNESIIINTWFQKTNEIMNRIILR